MTHLCVGKLTVIGSDNGMSPGRRQALIWTSAGILLTGPLGTNFSEILIGILTLSFKEMHLKLSSAKWRPFCRPRCVNKSPEECWRLSWYPFAMYFFHVSLNTGNLFTEYRQLLCQHVLQKKSSIIVIMLFHINQIFFLVGNSPLLGGKSVTENDSGSIACWWSRGFCLQWGRIVTTWAIWLAANDRRCEYTTMYHQTGMCW